MISRKEALIELILKKEDQYELPMDDLLFDQLHDRIMQAVDKLETHQQTKWSKTRIFLESKARIFRLPSKV
jgi:hypothetical protein